MTRQNIPNIRSLSGFALFLEVLTVLIVLTASVRAQNPVPFVDQPLLPDATAPGGPAFTLTVNGAGFVAGSVVNWNGSPRATTFVSKSRLTATISSSDIAKASTASVTVVSPGSGGGVSNAQYFSIVVAETSVSFMPAVTYNSGGGQPVSIALTDLNGDGKPDIVLADSQSGTLGVLLGNGDGTFGPVTIYAAGAAPSGVAVADVNGDGRLDIVVANACQSVGSCSSGALRVLLGNGDGTFQSATSYSSGSGQAGKVAVADLNGDGKLDVVVSIWSGSEDEYGFSAVGVFLGNGDGTFQPIVKYDSGADSDSITVADVNGDGKLDLLIGNATTVAVLLGNGDGTFQPRAEYPTIPPGTIPVGVGQVVVADINGDGKPDLLASNQGGGSNGDGSVAILFGNGDGTFQSPIDYDSGAITDFSLAVADVNGDGKMDVVAADYATSFSNTDWNPNGFVGVIVGNGDGTFRPTMTYSAGGLFSIALVAADVNGDGRPDLVVANQGSNTVSVLLNTSTSSQSPTTTALACSTNQSIYGQSVTFTAAVAASAGTPAGTVVLYNGSTVVGSRTLSSGKTSISISSLPAGTHSITAAYQGSPTFASSTSSPLVQTVSAASTSTTLTSSLNPAGTAESMTFTATVTSQFGGAATGETTFYSGTLTLGTASLSGNTATLTTSFPTAGTYSISAKYNGDGNNLGSTSSALSEVIITSTTTALTSSITPSLVGQAVTFTARVSSIAGTPPNGEIVTFKNGSSVLGTGALSGGIAALTTSSLPAGADTITASYGGDANFAASISPGLRQVVNSPVKSATSTTLLSSLNPSTYGQSVTWRATVTTTGPWPPTGTVNFAWDGYSIGTATLNANGVASLTKSNLNVYTYPLTAVYLGDADNAGSTSAVVNQVVKAATSTASLSSSLNPSTQGQAVTFTASISSPTVAPTGPVTFAVGTTVLGMAQLSGGKATFSTSTLAAGSTTVKATYNGDSNIAESSASVTQVVQP